jgi:O-antigen/teichoic acid export membrane protein
MPPAESEAHGHRGSGFLITGSLKASLDSLRSSGFLGHILTVLKGNVAAIVIGFLALPLLSRLFPPESFGIFQSTTSMLTLVLVGASLRYDIPLLMTRGRMELRSLLTLNVGINLCVALLVALVALTAAFAFPAQTGAYKIVLMIAPLWILAASLMQTFSYVVLHEHAFGTAAGAKVAQASTNAGTGLLLGLLWPSAGGLLLADLVGRLGALTVLVRRCRGLILPLRARRTVRAVWLVARRYRDFPRISLLSALINTGGGTLVPVLMLLSFNVETIGQFALLDRSVGIIIAVVAQSVSQVFMTSFAKALRDSGENPLGMFRRTIMLQFAVGIVPTIAMMVLAPWVFTLVFGARWAMAGQFGVIMAPFYLVGFMVVPVSTVLLILENQRLQFIWDLLRTIAVVVLWVAAGWLRLQPVHALVAYSALGSIFYLLYIYLGHEEIRRRYAEGSSR